MFDPYYQSNYNNPYYYQQPQQPQIKPVSQFIEIANENEIGSRLMPRDGTPVFYRIKDTQDVYQCAFINGQTCITAYTLTPKISNVAQQQPVQQQQQKPVDLASTVEQLNQRLSHVEAYLQELTAGGNNATVRSASSEQSARPVTATVV